MGLGTAGLLTGGYTAKAAGFPQNETVQIGIIGAGGRARQLMQRLAASPGVRMTAVCDIYDPLLAEARKLAPPSAPAEAGVLAAMVLPPRPAGCAVAHARNGGE